MSELFENIMKGFIQIGKDINRPDVSKQAQKYLDEAKMKTEKEKIFTEMATIIYNKKLITSNENVKDEIFYDENMMLVFTGNESISDFLSRKSIPFSDKSKSLFSPYTLFNNF